MTFWDRFTRQVQLDLRLWLFFLAALSLYRATFLVVFRHQILPDGGGSHAAFALLRGLQFDASLATLLILPSFLMSTLCGLWDLETIARQVRTTVGVLFCIVTPFLSCVAIEFYREYRELFNPVLFDGLSDDRAILLKTLYAEYHLVALLMLSVVLSTVSSLLLRRWISRPLVSELWIAKWSGRRPARLALSAAIVGLVAFGLQIPKSPLRSLDPVLNTSVSNPYLAFYYAVQLHRNLLNFARMRAHRPIEQFATAAKRTFPEAPVSDDLDRCLLRSAAGPRNAPPKHIILVGMESYDAWPLMDEYQSLGITNNVRRFAREGLHVKSFVPSGWLSVVFLQTVITGLPDTGIPLTHHHASAMPFPTALPETMRKLGYRTRFFCGSLTGWQNCQQFCPNQGFDEVYFATDFLRGTRFAQHKIVWGAPDEAIFEFAASKIKDDEPSFSFIFTCSYHPPYEIDLEAEGCPLKEVPADLVSKWEEDPQKYLRVLGHLWYADRCIGRFVDQMEARLTRPLFALTGDHFGRHFINFHPTLYERSAVPLVLYGPEVLKGVELPAGVAGRHIDINPTLIELAAPRDFEYHAFGWNLLAPREQFFGFGPRGCVIGYDYIFDFDHPEELCPIPGRPLPQTRPDVANLQYLYHAVRDLSWWRVERGPKIRAPAPAED